MRLKTSFQTHFSIQFCDPCRIQTCNPHIRSVVLYSVELMDPEVSPLIGETGLRRKGNLYPPYSKERAKLLLFFELCKFFGKKMQI